MNAPQKRRSPARTGLDRSTTFVANYTTLPIDILLPRLEGVQRSGKGYRALCPNCGGKSRKLAIAQDVNGTLLLNCFSCRDTPAILAAIGLALADLYPARIRDDTPQGRRAAQHSFKQTGWAAALGVLACEATVAEVATAMILRGDVLTAEDIERVRIASQRIHDAREVLQ